MKFLSEENVPYSEQTPVEALVSRFFTIITRDYRIKVEGQFLSPDLGATKYSWREELRESLKQIEHPIFIQREIENYIQRIDIWLDSKYGIGNENALLDTEEAKTILVEALADPECPWNVVRDIERQWRKQYNEL